MKLKTILAAALSLGFAVAGHAATYTVTTDAYSNSSANGADSGADAGLYLTEGTVFSVSTDADQLWHGAYDGNYDLLTTNADGTSSHGWTIDLNGIDSSVLTVGTLVAEIDGEYRIIGAGTSTFTAWASGEITFFYADVNSYDNWGSVTSTISVVPEPASLALMAAGLGLVGVARRRKNAAQ